MFRLIVKVVGADEVTSPELQVGLEQPAVKRRGHVPKPIDRHGNGNGRIAFTRMGTVPCGIEE